MFGDSRNTLPLFVWPMTVVLLICVLFYSRNVSTKLFNEMETYRPLLMAQGTEDLLIGKRIEGFLSEYLAEQIYRGNPIKPTVVWIIDPSRCEDCLHDLGSWNALQSAYGISTLIVIDGVPESGLGSTRSQATRGAGLFVDSTGVVANELGLPGPSARLLVGRQGRILLADLRRPGNRCSWSFEAQVVALLAPFGDPMEIRSLDPPTSW